MGGGEKKGGIGEEKCFWHILDNFFLDLQLSQMCTQPSLNARKIFPSALGQDILFFQASVDPYVEVRG